jgi:WD repeat-containing protein 35
MAYAYHAPRAHTRTSYYGGHPTYLPTRYIDVKPDFLSITAHHVVAASADFVYVWHYRTLMSKLTSVDSGGSSLRRKEGRERSFHIDDTPAAMNAEAVAVVAGREPSADPIVAVAASASCLLVARDSGVMHRYSLPHIALEHKYTLRCRPQTIAINCDSSRLSIIDLNGVLTFFDLATDSTGGEVKAPSSGEAEGSAGGRFERKDVWDMRWSTDNPELFALMEKARMFIFRNLVPEEPVLSSAYLCSFSDLEIRAVLLDQLMKEPDERSKEYVLKFETKALRETRELLEQPTLGEASSFIEANPHPRLWRLLAEVRLHKGAAVTPCHASTLQPHALHPPCNPTCSAALQPTPRARRSGVPAEGGLPSGGEGVRALRRLLRHTVRQAAASARRPEEAGGGGRDPLLTEPQPQPQPQPQPCP